LSRAVFFVALTDEDKMRVRLTRQPIVRGSSPTIALAPIPSFVVVSQSVSEAV